jgi:RNA polymerase sigma factor (sigma-70 family)
MAEHALGTVVRQLRGLLGRRAAGALTDRELLERFTVRHDEAAFAALLERHGAMVLAVCRRVLRHEQDAEDAFQAAFLVLARKAGSIREGSVGGWLYQVAYHVALRAREEAARRRHHERQVRAMSPAEPPADPDRLDLRPLLDAEVGRLPAKYRAPVVLCYLEGRSHGEAAEQLGWPVGTVKGRLARARSLLQARLVRRGVTLSAGLVAAALAESAAAGGVPAPLATSTVSAAIAFAAHPAAAVASAHAAALAEGVIRAMFLTKLKVAAAVLVALGLTGAGAGVLTHQALAAKQTDTPVARGPDAAEPGDPPKDAGKKPPSADKKEDEKEDPGELTALRERSTLNLKQIALAMHNYHDTNAHLPPAAIRDKNGKALLSWRVAILPWIEQDALYRSFHLDEAWDSPHNKELLAQVPPIYAPVRNKPKDPNATYYQVFVGPGTVFERAKGQRINDITDGLSNTLLVVEAGEAVPWTKPADLPYDPEKPLPKLGGLFPDGFHAALCDGSVHFLKKKDYDEKTMRAAITRNDGINIDLNTLKP